MWRWRAGKGREKPASGDASDSETVKPDDDDDRESPITVAKKLLPWCFALIVALTIAWTALVAWDEIERGEHAGWRQLIIAIVDKAAPASPYIVLCAIMTVSVSDFLGGVVVVTAKYLGNKFVKPVIAGHRAKGREEGLAEGLELGLIQGEDRERRRWTRWNNRRLEAEARGETFDEPPPSDDVEDDESERS